MAITVALGAAGHAWERSLQVQGATVLEARTLVDLLVIAEVHAPDIIVVAEDFPRLSEGLTQLRGRGRVVIVGASAWADCAAEDISLQMLRALVAPVTGSRGQFIAVWGPQGSWGVTSMAIGLGRSLSARGPTLLADTNVHVPTIADEFAMPMGGLFEACLSVDRGKPDLPVRTQGWLSVLTGVDPAMYPSVHPAALREVLDMARSQSRWIVADTDSAIDSAGEIGLVPDWTTATSVVLQEADHVVIVVGEQERAMTRLWRALPTVAQTVRGATTVVVNRCRSPRTVTTRLAERLGDHLPEAAIGWVPDRITAKSLAPIVAEVAREVAAGR